VEAERKGFPLIHTPNIVSYSATAQQYGLGEGEDICTALLLRAGVLTSIFRERNERSPFQWRCAVVGLISHTEIEPSVLLRKWEVPFFIFIFFNQSLSSPHSKLF